MALELFPVAGRCELPRAPAWLMPLLGLKGPSLTVVSVHPEPSTGPGVDSTLGKPLRKGKKMERGMHFIMNVATKNSGNSDLCTRHGSSIICHIRRMVEARSWRPTAPGTFWNSL